VDASGIFLIRENRRGDLRTTTGYFRALRAKKHPEAVFHPYFNRDCKLYIIISFLILNYIERFFRIKKY